jgi:hypothetical protein
MIRWLNFYQKLNKILQLTMHVLKRKNYSDSLPYTFICNARHHRLTTNI